jgi:hypothetical protein
MVHIMHILVWYYAYFMVGIIHIFACYRAYFSLVSDVILINCQILLRSAVALRPAKSKKFDRVSYR